MYRILLCCFFVLLVLVGISAGSGKPVNGNLLKKSILRTVVIDPGHGGHDSGCHGSSAYEKHIALAVSIKLGKLIEANFPDVKVIFTRKTDVFVELYRRAQIANENKADLFICIHCNSGPKTAFGTETFVMGLHKTTDNLNVAKRENAVILQENNYERKYDGFDPNSPEANIIFSLYQNAFLTQSLYFADRLQHEFKHSAKRYNRGVKQAGFLVLYRTTMPAILIETGFLTNNEEEKYLKSADGQQEIANSMLKAFNDYKNWVDGTADTRELQFPKLAKEKQSELKPTDSAPVASEKAEETYEIRKPDLKQGETAAINQVQFRVQIVQSDERLRLTSSQFKGRVDVWEYRWNNSWKYTVGEYNILEDAVKLQAEMKKVGFSDAFVVAFKNNDRITLQEAQAAHP
jgi:N-acetylmuramoyl-L-alanine amidase